jgi:N-acetylneuraminic acid mutarotase
MSYYQIKAGLNLQIFAILFFLTFASLVNAQNTGLWVTASSTGFSPRFELSCCELNGKIYATGGYDFTDTLAPKRIEIFDPTTSSWTAPAIPGNIPYFINHTSIAFNNKIYLIGGNGKHEVDIFDPATNTLTTPNTSGNFIWRAALTSAEVNGKFYVIGGDSGYLNTVATLQMFDPQTNTWSTPTTSGTFTPRTYLASAVVNGKIYVIGGENDSGQQLNTLEVFDPSTNSWSTPTTTGTFIPKSTTTGLGCGVIDGKIYVVGSTTNVFDPSKNTWDTVAVNGTFTNRGAFGYVIYNRNLFTMGGWVNKNVQRNLNQVFTPSTSGVAMQQTQSNISIYPNPTTGNVTLYNIPENAISIQIVNILGQKIAEFKPSANIDLSKLQSGLYYIKFITSNSIITQKIIKE